MTKIDDCIGNTLAPWLLLWVRSWLHLTVVAKYSEAV